MYNNVQNIQQKLVLYSGNTLMMDITTRRLANDKYITGDLSPEQATTLIAYRNAIASDMHTFITTAVGKGGGSKAKYIRSILYSKRQAAQIKIMEAAQIKIMEAQALEQAQEGEQ